MRMDRTHRPNENALNMRACRYWRPAYSLLSWHCKRTSPKEARVLALLSRAQLRSNTTRGTTPGLIHPNLGEAGGRIPHPVHRNGQRQGRAQRNVATQSTSDDDEEQSEDDDETSDDGSSRSDEDEDELDADEELNADEELDLDAGVDQDSDSGEDLSDIAEEEYDSDSALSSGRVGFRGSSESATNEEQRKAEQGRPSMEEQVKRQRNASTTYNTWEYNIC